MVNKTDGDADDQDYPKDGLNLVRIGGLDYCKPHKLEVCGKCRYNFALTNAMQEIHSMHPEKQLADVVNIAEEQVRQDERKGKAPRRADGEQPSLPLAPEHSKLDLSVCQFWNKGGPELVKPFRATLSMTESFALNDDWNSAQNLGMDIGMDAHVKAIFVEVASIYQDNMDNYERDHDNNIIYGRCLVQEEKSHSEGVIMDVLSALVAPKSHASPFVTNSSQDDDANADSPLLVIRYAYSTAGTPQAELKALFDMVPEGVLRRMGGSVEVDARTVRRLKDILDQNRRELDSNWLETKERGLPPPMKISVVVPLIDTEYKAALDETKCPGCGREANLTCTRCGKQKYCSRTCQRGHWPKHKKVCTPKAGKKDQVPSGRTATVDLRVDTGRHFALLSHKNPLGSMKVQGKRKSAAESAPKGVFAIKIQVGIIGFQAMAVYDRTRSFQCEITEQNCTQAREIDAIIRRKGEAGGLKGYFNAIVRDGKLVVFIDNLLGLLPW